MKDEFEFQPIKDYGETWFQRKTRSAGRDAAGCLAHLTRGERISAIVSMMGYLYSEIDPAMMNDGLEEMVEASEEFLLMIKEAASNKKGDS